MVFSDNLFLFYFLPVFLIAYFICPHKLKNLFALGGSLAFYAFGAPTFIFIVLGSIIVDFYLVRIMVNSQGRKKNLLLAASVALNIGLLLYFKYCNFFLENISVLLQTLGFSSIHWVKVALPIGISFFSFQKMTYAVDVYRKVHAPLKHVWDFALYILIFPQLIAGPIVRFNEIADEIEDRRKNETIDNKLTGFFRFAVGLAKKVFIANTLGEQVDIIFATQPGELTTPVAWMGVIAYAFQIYFDFSAYSDMAIGLGRMMGFNFPENFNNPYISQSISEFWRRWHMTLGRWMRDYLYIPLGGSKVSVKRMYINLWIVFLISGFWHGAAWNFIIWGAFHGFFLIADRMFLLKFYAFIGKYPSIFITFIITLVGWVYFRADSLSYANAYLVKMFSFELVSFRYLFDTKFYMILIAAIIFSFYAVLPGTEKWQIRVFHEKQKNHTILLMSFAAIFLVFVSASVLSSSGFNPFIYFRF
ncbi:MAG: sugar acetyltransferase [Bacteroidetes bacterium GWF2_38_335]|nr:MAG: sugar acetyltransferase [Bacteroidetes bacterium GWF2_38_335]OFY77419.1 MAG: sugar acetyltransferase [Bacteroidetes bacterium RIFOXYA12_FULL_38_20]HBS87293.1 MBOAT family protein [Bacteroidales bacterium]